jgi:hypothetical protein
LSRKKWIVIPNPFALVNPKKGFTKINSYKGTLLLLRIELRNSWVEKMDQRSESISITKSKKRAH